MAKKKVGKKKTTRKPAKKAALQPLRLTIDLVPESCWYKSLRREMPRRAWDKHREMMLADQGSVCCHCGGTDRLNCHEIWVYEDKASVQRLTGFQIVCGMCHHVTHFGMSQVLAAQGHLDLEAVVDHFLKVNGVDRKVFQFHLNEAFETWRQRSMRKWTTDLGEWASLVPPKTP